MFGELEVQKMITNQLTTLSNEICCSAIGTILSYDKNNNKFLVQLDNELKFKDQIISNKIYCKPFQDKTHQRPYEIGDKVFISFTDYNSNITSIPINIKKTKKHLLENGVILLNLTEYYNIKDIIYGNKEYDINIVGKDKITIKNKSGNAIQLNNAKIYLGNGEISLYDILIKVTEFNSENIQIIAPAGGGPCTFNGANSTWGMQIKTMIDKVLLKNYEDN